MTFSTHILLGTCFLFLHAIWVGICDLARKKKRKKLSITAVLNVAQSGSIAAFLKMWL